MSEQTINDRAFSEKQSGTKADFDKVGRFKFAINSTLGWLSAFFCFVCLLILSFIIILPPILAQAVGNWYAIMKADWFDVNSPIYFVIVCFTSIMLFFGGMVIGRFLLRAIPPRLSGKRRNGVIGCLALLTILWVVLLFQTFIDVDIDKDYNHLSAKLSEAPFFKNSEKFYNSAAYKVLGLLSLVFWSLGFIIPLGIRHLKPRYFLKKPFVLFLRRFSKFPDRAVQHALLKCTPSGKPVAYLTPTRSRAGDWNPFSIGISGIKFWYPIRSMPIILRSTNEAWKRAAQDLISHAEIIVLDVSEGSGAIQSEIDMISAADRWHNVIILTKEEIADTTNTEQIGQFSAKGAEVVVYKKSWIMALPRLIFGSFVTLLFLIYLFLLQYVVVVLIYRVAELPDSFLLLWIVVDVVLFFWMYIIFFVRPAIEKGALKTLSKKLRSA